MLRIYLKQSGVRLSAQLSPFSAEVTGFVRHPVREVRRQSIKAQDALIILLAVVQNQGVVGAIQLLHWQAKKPRVQAPFVPIVPQSLTHPPKQTSYC